MRSVWGIPTENLSEAHYAVSPQKLVSIPIDAGCPLKICLSCDRPVEYTFDNGEINASRPKSITAQALASYGASLL